MLINLQVNNGNEIRINGKVVKEYTQTELLDDG
jgi:tyrosine-protein phosphatase YwqE